MLSDTQVVQQYYEVNSAMLVKLKRCNPGSSVKTIRELVPAASANNHQDWIAFLNRHDGAVPDVNEFDVPPKGGSGIQRFFGGAEVSAAYSRLAGRLPNDLLPVGDAEGGNFVCLGLSRNRSGVFFWDHETEQTSLIATSFQEFIDCLRPLDSDSVQLRPGQVVSAWIDPSLLAAENGTKG